MTRDILIWNLEPTLWLSSVQLDKMESEIQINDQLNKIVIAMNFIHNLFLSRL